MNPSQTKTGQQLTHIEANMRVLYGGDKVTTIPDSIATAFQPGDAILVVQTTGEVLHIPKAARQSTSMAVKKCAHAFSQMGAITDKQISNFYTLFSQNLANDTIWKTIQTHNEEDVSTAKKKDRSTTRLEATEKMRNDMIEGLINQKESDSIRGHVIESHKHDGWSVECIQAELGIVGFVFEGRPNVLADATGVLRGGNGVVFRIGRDALQTAKAIMQHALNPAIKEAGLPEGIVSLIEHSEHAAGWALFTDTRVSLAVARGSGKAVETLGTLANQSGVPVSLHGTGGAWIITDESTDANFFSKVIEHSLDRKVCNTLNTCCIHHSQAKILIPVLLSALERAAKKRNSTFKIHVVDTDKNVIDQDYYTKKVMVARANGPSEEFQAETLSISECGREWEWENSPEITLKIIQDLKEGIDIYNQYSPQFVASLISTNSHAQESFYQHINAPFVGNGFTRWADGQYALNAPELGLSNWQNGRILARSAILNGKSVFTIRTRMTQEKADLHR